MSAQPNSTTSRIESLRRASALFDEALAQEPSARDAWLAALSARDPVVARDVRSLLEAHDRVANSAFLDQTIGPESIDVDTAREENAPSIVGPYRILKQIGAGGMSTVWLAERAFDGFTKQVALKRLPTFLRHPAHEKRMQREAAILAKVDHPNIARFLDASIASDDAPYIVLEFIDGESITSYCDRLRMNVRDRVKLMIDVCEAVAFLHQHAIVHRDIKPSNIMVDGQGNVKLLDFGIAKLLGDDGSDSDDAFFTHSSANAFTPEFASPEQISGKTLTTATDVYSLGVLLYRLLTGSRPYGRTVPAPLLPTEIVNTQPSKPSTLFGQYSEVSPAELATIAAMRQSTARQLGTALKNDIDTILLKTLEKDVTRRYATVEALRADLEAYLDSRPIQAMPPSALYALRKFANRHRGGVVASSLALLGFIVALAFGAWQARQTQLEVVKTKRVLTFLQTLIAEANPNKTGVQTITVLDLLSRAPGVAKQQFPNEPALQYEMLKPVERILRDLEAANALAPVEAAMVALLPSVPNVPITEDAELRTEYALTLAYLGKLDAADAMLNETLQRLKAAGQENSVASARVLMRQASVLAHRGKTADAANLATQAHTMLIANTGANDPLRTKYTFSLLDPLLKANRLADAKAIEEKYFTDAQIAALPDKKERLQYKAMKASLRWYLGNPRLGMQQYQALQPEFKAFFGERDLHYPQLLLLTARAAIDGEQHNAAISVLEQAMAIERTSPTPNVRTQIQHAAYLAIARQQSGDFGEAQMALATATRLIANAQPPIIYWQAAFLHSMKQRDWARAEKSLNERAMQLNESKQAFEYAELQMDRAELLFAQGKAAEATMLARTAATTIQSLVPADHFRRVRAERVLSRVRS